MQRYLAIRKDNRGLAAVEFALLSPVLITLILGVMELAYVASARSTLEAVTMKGARLIAATTCPSKRQALLTQTIDRGMAWVKSDDGKPPVVKAMAYGTQFGDVGEPEPFTDNPAAPNGKYDVGESYTDVNGNKQWDADMGRDGSIGDANQVVSYSATFRVKSLVPYLARQFVGQEYYLISASTVIRNEPIFRSSGC